MIKGLALELNQVEFKLTSVKEETREINLCVTANNCFRIPNLSVSFKEQPKQNWPSNPVRILQPNYFEMSLIAYLQSVVSEYLILNEGIFSNFEDLFNEKIDILPFSIIFVKEIKEKVLIPIDFIEIEDIVFYSREPVLESIKLGHYLTFFNQPLRNVCGKYILRDNGLIQNAKVIAFINRMLLEEKVQNKMRQAYRLSQSKDFYSFVCFEEEKSPLLFS